MNETSAAAAEAAQDAIIDEFAFFGDWTERYQYLIDLGRKLGDFPAEWKTEANKVHGCQSQVWLVPSGDAARMEFSAASDSSIVTGLIALLLRAGRWVSLVLIGLLCLATPVAALAMVLATPTECTVAHQQVGGDCQPSAEE